MSHPAHCLKEHKTQRKPKGGQEGQTDKGNIERSLCSLTHVCQPWLRRKLRRMKNE